MFRWLPALIVLTITFYSVLAADLSSQIRQELPEALRNYRHLHGQPELSYQEKETSRFVARHLIDYGFSVSERVGKYEGKPDPAYGLVGILENGEGPVVLVRTDLDALPVDEQTGLSYASAVRVQTAEGIETGVMHACGHDMHMAVFLGTARLLSRSRGLWSGTLVFVGQPAEERGAGALALLSDGLYQRFPKPDYALALHVSADLPSGKVGYRSGFALASVDSVDIRVRGVGGHGAYPHRTLDPVVTAAQLVLNLQTIVSRTVSPLEAAVVTVGSIRGGAKHNVIPDFVDLQLTVRSYEPSVRQTILESIRRIAKGTAEAAGIPPELMPEVRIAEEEYTPSTYNDPELLERLLAALKRELSEERVEEVDPVMAGEDFSRYRLEGNQVPSCLLWLGTVDPVRFSAAASGAASLPPLHSSQFAPDAEASLETGIRALSSAVLELAGRKP